MVASGTALHFLAINQQSPAVMITLGPVHDLTAAGDQIWVAAGSPARLHRFTSRGDAIGPPLNLEGHVGLLRAAETGSPAAVWTASPISVVSETGMTRIPGDPEWVVPISNLRWVVCTRDRITFRDQTSERWTVSSPGGRVVDGTALLDGRAVALVFAAPNGTLSQLVVLGIHDGSIHQRITLSGVEAVFFAPARGYAVLRAGGKRLVLVDLRFGRVIKEHHEEREITDLAIDDGAHSLMLRFGDGHHDVTITSVRALVTATAVTSTADTSPVVEEAAPPPDKPAAIVVEFHRTAASLVDVRALPLQPPLPTMATGTARAILDRYREYVRALTGRAIAAGWNDGRLTFPNEGLLPFKAEVAGLLGTDANRARAELNEANDRVQQVLASMTATEASSGPAPTPMTALAADFGLSPVARQILLVVAAPALWGDFARLYGILSNDDARPLVDEHLVSQILAHDMREYDISRELDRESPLIKHGLIQVGVGRMRPFLPLRCEPVVLRILRGAAQTVDLEGVCVVETTMSFESLLIPAAIKERIIELVEVPPQHGPGRVVVRGRVGSGRHTLLATLADASGRRLGIVDATIMVRDLKTRAEEMRAAIRRAHLSGLVPCIDGLESLPTEDQAGRDILRELLDEHPGPLAIRLPWDAQPPIAPGYVLIDLPTLSIDQRTTCWRIFLAAHDLDVREPDELATRFSVGPGIMAAACVHVAGLRRDRRSGAGVLDITVALEQAIRQHLETRLRLTATRVTRLATWAKVVLPADIQDSVLELIARIKHRRTVYDVWGYDQVLTTSRGVTALFSGGPGTGKTLVASAIANELGMDLYRVDLSRVMSKWIGETEQNLAKLFDAAEDGHAIILFDEADSLFAKRTEVRSSVDRYANLEVNYLLQRFDTFEGIAILTTNFGTAIDNAFKRRLSFRLTFPFPDEEARESLWRSHVPPQVPRAGTFDFAALAHRYQLSGGYIRNAALRAAFIAAEEHSPLRQDHLERAVEAEFREIGKFASSGILE